MTAAPKPYHHGDLRNALVAAATNLVAERGSASFSLREVATRAGVSHPACYRHFADKQALLAAVAGEGFAALRAAQVETLEKAGPDARARLLALALAYWDFAAASPGSFQVMFGESWADAPADPQAQAMREESFGLLRLEVEAAARAGALPSASAHMVAALWSLCHGLCILVIADSGQLSVLPEAGTQTPRAFATQTISAMLDTLAAAEPENW